MLTCPTRQAWIAESDHRDEDGNALVLPPGQRVRLHAAGAPLAADAKLLQMSKEETEGMEVKFVPAITLQPGGGGLDGEEDEDDEGEGYDE